MDPIALESYDFLLHNLEVLADKQLLTLLIMTEEVLVNRNKDLNRFWENWINKNDN